MSILASDQRRIVSVAEIGCGDSRHQPYSYRVGKGTGVRLIECYDEYGEMTAVPWLAIYEDGDPDGSPSIRVAARHFLVGYAAPAEQGKEE